MTPEELQVKLELWVKDYPELVRKPLSEGGNIIKRAIQSEWSSHNQSGKLSRSVRVQVKLNPISAKVDVPNSQQYKAQVFEGKAKMPIVARARGSMYRRNKSGRLMKVSWSGSPFLQVGPSRFGNYYYGRPSQVTIPSRPIWERIARSLMPTVLRNIEGAMVKGFKEA